MFLCFILSYEAQISERISPKHTVVTVSVPGEEQDRWIGGPDRQQRRRPALRSAAASCPQSQMANYKTQTGLCLNTGT